MATQKEIGIHLGLSARRVADVLRDLQLPTKDCDLDKARLAYISDLREKAAGRYTKGDLDLAAERARLTFHQANIAELDEKVRIGELIPAETVEKVWSDMIASFRAKVLSVPTKAAHQFVALTDLSEIQESLKEHLYDALTELASYEPKQYGINDDE